MIWVVVGVGLALIAILWYRLTELRAMVSRSARFVEGLDNSTARCFDERNDTIRELERRLAEIDRRTRHIDPIPDDIWREMKRRG